MFDVRISKMPTANFPKFMRSLDFMGSPFVVLLNERGEIFPARYTSRAFINNTVFGRALSKHRRWTELESLSSEKGLLSCGVTHNIEGNGSSRESHVASEGFYLS
jgi:hypothetical protein